MKFLKLSLFVFPLFLFTQTYAENVDTSQLNTGTFRVEDEYSASELQEEDQLKMQRQEEVERDSFGNDEYNQNVDPDIYLQEAERIDPEMDNE